MQVLTFVSLTLLLHAGLLLAGPVWMEDSFEGLGGDIKLTSEQRKMIDEMLRKEQDGSYIARAILESLEDLENPDLGDIKLTSEQRKMIDEMLRKEQDGSYIARTSTVDHLGDIWLTPKQRKMIDEGSYTARTSAVIIDSAYMWPKAVMPYSFDSSVSPSARSIIDDAMAEISKHTCISFVPRSSERNYALFTSYRANQCYSYIGVIGTGPQEISIGRGFCETKGIVMHEIIHALGRWHEQSRPDRDDYITLHKENMRPGVESEYFKLNVGDATTNDVPYDYYSIMHYKAYQGSSNGCPVMTAVNNRANWDDLGRAVDTGILTDYDIAHLEKLYCQDDNGRGDCCKPTITTSSIQPFGARRVSVAITADSGGCSNGQGYRYSVEWGDGGASDNGDLDTNFPISIMHIYDTTGKYRVDAWYCQGSCCAEISQDLYVY